MHRTALTIAIVGMFVLAGVGHFSGLSVFACTVRSLAGAAGIYVLTLVAMRLALAIFVSAIMQSNQNSRTGNHNRGNGQ